jgi:hypothetical protein
MDYFNMNKFYKVLRDDYPNMNNCASDHRGNILLFVGDDTDTTNTELERIWYYLECKHGGKTYRNLYDPEGLKEVPVMDESYFSELEILF